MDVEFHFSNKNKLMQLDSKSKTNDEMGQAFENFSCELDATAANKGTSSRAWQQHSEKINVQRKVSCQKRETSKFFILQNTT